MDCPQLPKVSAYHDRALPEHEQSSFAQHCESCAQCRLELARLERLSAFLSSAPLDDRRPRMAFSAQLQQKRMLQFAQFFTAAAAIVFLGCGIALLRMSNDSSTTTQARSWERLAITQQIDAAPAPDEEDILVQALFREDR
ncbi:MAG TPA: hypothetical protein VEK08_03600 [Planctomycetota bacterium]|nr:hypothetical protein [Planctomycetota bacterium]